MTIDLTTLKDWLSVIAIAISVVSTVWVWFQSRSEDVDEKIKAGDARLEARIEDQALFQRQLGQRQDAEDMRLSRLEQTVSEMPKRDDIHKVELQLAAMTGALGRIEAVMEGNAQIMARLETIVTRHEDHLLNKG